MILDDTARAERDLHRVYISTAFTACVSCKYPLSILQTAVSTSISTCHLQISIHSYQLNSLYINYFPACISSVILTTNASFFASIIPSSLVEIQTNMLFPTVLLSTLPYLLTPCLATPITLQATTIPVPDPGYTCGFVSLWHNSSASASVHATRTCEGFYFDRKLNDWHDAWAYEAMGGCDCVFYQ